MSVREVSITGGVGVSPVTPGVYTFANLPSAVPGVSQDQVFAVAKGSGRLSGLAAEINGLCQKYICTYGATRIFNYDDLVAVGG